MLIFSIWEASKWDIYLSKFLDFFKKNNAFFKKYHRNNVLKKLIQKIGSEMAAIFGKSLRMDTI